MQTETKKKIEVGAYILYRKDITQRLKRVLIQKLMLQLEETEIDNDTPLFGLGLGLDSIDTLEIVVGVEEEFGVSITDEDMSAFRSINTILDFIIDKINNQISNSSEE